MNAKPAATPQYALQLAIPFAIRCMRTAAFAPATRLSPSICLILHAYYVYATVALRYATILLEFLTKFIIIVGFDRHVE